MYKLKPVFRVPLELQNTCTMYKLKNLHEKTVDAFNKVAEQVNHLPPLRVFAIIHTRLT